MRRSRNPRDKEDKCPILRNRKVSSPYIFFVPGDPGPDIPPARLWRSKLPQWGMMDRVYGVVLISKQAYRAHAMLLLFCFFLMKQVMDLR